MTNIAWAGASRREDANRGILTRRVVGLLAVVGYFCSTFVESVTSTVNGDLPAATQLSYISSHLSTIRTQVLFEFLTPVFLLIAVLVLVGEMRRRGVWLAGAGGVLGILGALAFTTGAAVHLVVLVLIDSGAPRSASEAILAAQLPDAVFFLFFAVPAAFVVLAAAAWRAKITTWIPFAATCLFVALDLSGLLPEFVPLAIGLLSVCAIAWGLVRATNVVSIGDVRPAALDKMYESQQSGGDRAQV